MLFFTVREGSAGPPLKNVMLEIVNCPLIPICSCSHEQLHASERGVESQQYSLK
jgi:hypothetical protein